jgi:hypothetical protein
MEFQIITSELLDQYTAMVKESPLEKLEKMSRGQRNRCGNRLYTWGRPACRGICKAHPCDSGRIGHRGHGNGPRDLAAFLQMSFFRFAFRVIGLFGFLEHIQQQNNGKNDGYIRKEQGHRLQVERFGGDA